MDALRQLQGVPGLVGSLLFDAQGRLEASTFPAEYVREALVELAFALARDHFFDEWTQGDSSTFDLRFAQGTVLIRRAGAGWLLALCSAEANPQLVHMSLVQVQRRLRVDPTVRPTAPEAPRPTPAPSPPDPIPPLTSAPRPPRTSPSRPRASGPPPVLAPVVGASRGDGARPMPPGPPVRLLLEAMVRVELAGRATRALELIAEAGDDRQALDRAIGEVEKVARTFVEPEQAAELSRRMRQALSE